MVAVAVVNVVPAVAVDSEGEAAAAMSIAQCSLDCNGVKVDDDKRVP